LIGYDLAVKNKYLATVQSTQRKNLFDRVLQAPVMLAQNLTAENLPRSLAFFAPLREKNNITT